MKFSCVPTDNLWSAVTRHRFFRLADSSARQSRVQRILKQVGRVFAFDGDKSPAQSADKSAHSKARGLTMNTISVPTDNLWSAVTRRRFSRLADSSAEPGRVQRLVKQVGCAFALDGDKSPAESADKSAHSKGRALLRNSN